MVTRINLTLRYIPLVIYLSLVYVFLFTGNLTSGIFDFWSPMIVSFPAEFVSWFIAGIYVVALCFSLMVLRLFITRLSFQGLNEGIPQTDRWESIQMFLLLANLAVPIIIGLFFTFTLLTTEQFQWLLIIWIIFNFLPDFSYYFYWISTTPAIE